MALPTRFVLLDLDGTLIDSQPGITASCSAAVRALGHAPPAGFDIGAMIGPPLDDVMRALLAPFGDDRVGEAVAAYRADYAAGGLFRNTLYPGIAPMLAQISAAGVRLFVATSKRTEFARRILQRHRLAGMFDAIYGSDASGALDHKAALIGHILAERDLRAERGVMVGDRRYDIEGARANGVHAIGVLWGYGSREELERAGANALADVPAGLGDMVLARVGS